MISALVGALLLGFGLSGAAAETDQSKTAGGVTVYLGVKGLPASSSAERPMHGRIPKGPHEYHMGCLRCSEWRWVSDAVVTADVSGLGLSSNKKKLEPMQIAGTTTYGGFFDLPGFDIYTVKLTVERGRTGPAVLQFKYDYRH
jgi:hypothetical protein